MAPLGTRDYLCVCTFVISCEGPHDVFGFLGEKTGYKTTVKSSLLGGSYDVNFFFFNWQLAGNESFGKDPKQQVLIA